MRLLAAVAPFLLSGCVFDGKLLPGGFLEAAGPVAAAESEHFYFVTLLMIGVILPLFIALPIVLWRFRLGGKGRYRPNWDFNKFLEMLVWGIPVIAVSVLGVKLWLHTHQLDPYKPLGDDPLEVQVVTLDWKFLFLYPDQGVASIDRLVLPVDRPVTLELTSGTVMQSFMIPRLAGQIYSMAGMRTEQNLLASETGTFIGRNTQYNGNGFARQSFPVEVLDADGFAKWAQDTGTDGTALDWAAYETLQSTQAEGEETLFSSFPDGLFHRVIAQFAPNMAEGMH